MYSGSKGTKKTRGRRGIRVPLLCGPCFEATFWSLVFKDYNPSRRVRRIRGFILEEDFLSSVWASILYSIYSIYIILYIV